MNEMLVPKVTYSQGLNVTSSFATIGYMDTPQELFSKRLNDLCDESGIPEKGKGRQLAVAKLFGVSQKAARKWLEGEGVPEYERCYTMAVHFNVNYEWLMTGRGLKRTGNGILVEDQMEMRLLETFKHMCAEDRATYIRMGGALAEPAPKERSHQ